MNLFNVYLDDNSSDDEHKKIPRIDEDEPNSPVRDGNKNQTNPSRTDPIRSNDESEKSRSVKKIRTDNYYRTTNTLPRLEWVP